MNKTKKNAFRRMIMGETPTPERFQHTGGLRREVIKADDRRGRAALRYRARWPGPLDLYRDKMILSDAQYEAGIWFWQAYHRAVSGWGATHARAARIDRPTASDVPDGVRRALATIKEAYAVLTSDTMSVVTDVCAYGQPAASPAELALLRKGLGRLAQEWSVAADEVCERKD